MTKLSLYICQEILTHDDEPRVWSNNENAVGVAHELANFFDHLLAWEEQTQEQFLPILKRSHKTGIAKAFSLLAFPIRQLSYSPTFLGQCRSQRIKRLPLADSPKLVISDEAHLSLIIQSEDSGKRPSRKRKTPQR